MDSNDAVHVWHRAGNPTSTERLSNYAEALISECSIGAYRALNDAQEDRAILALFRVDQPQATIASLHQMPPLALSGYHQLLHDLAREGFGPGSGIHGETSRLRHPSETTLH
ncbi:MULTISPECIES: hypothetical protein [Arthrobacter]|uniref:Uncharacterized protein n=1 Tax=Arthrobacter terricola TaxID=2547396 RepID=A0A4R5KVZ1_9MICC|nr:MULTISPECIES: hypothetical protein [Arthrobacter]MBT8159767.1 hypothetical protein [Arthrobacter sp. GN70]TDF99130.1 hypothetical protein E1809_06060 [Arthrobacter terricola]